MRPTGIHAPPVPETIGKVVSAMAGDTGHIHVSFIVDTNSNLHHWGGARNI